MVLHIHNVLVVGSTHFQMSGYDYTSTCSTGFHFLYWQQQIVSILKFFEYWFIYYLLDQHFHKLLRYCNMINTSAIHVSMTTNNQNMWANSWIITEMVQTFYIPRQNLNMKEKKRKKIGRKICFYQQNKAIKISLISPLILYNLSNRVL